MTEEYRPRKFYLAGPMRGQPNHGFPRFIEAEAFLSSRGLACMNPAQPGDLTLEGEPAYTLDHYLRRDVCMMAECDAIVLLPGWRTSQGVAFEIQVAQAMNMRFFLMVRWREGWELKEVTDALGSRPWEDERLRMCERYDGAV